MSPTQFNAFIQQTNKKKNYLNEVPCEQVGLLMTFQIKGQINETLSPGYAAVQCNLSPYSHNSMDTYTICSFAL